MPQSAALPAPPQWQDASYAPLTPSFPSPLLQGPLHPPQPPPLLSHPRQPRQRHRPRRRHPRVPKRILLIPRSVRKHRRARRRGDNGSGAMAAAATVRSAQGLGGREDGRWPAAENWRAGEGVGMRPEDVVAPRGSEVGGADRGDWHAVAESRAPPGDVGLAVWILEAAGRGRGADGVAGVVCAVVACGMSVGSLSGETLEGTVD